MIKLFDRHCFLPLHIVYIVHKSQIDKYLTLYRIQALLMDNSYSTMNPDGQELERLRSENHKFQLTNDHLSKKHELELDALKTKYE